MKVQFIFIAVLFAAVFYGCEKVKSLTGVFKAKYVGGMCGQNIIEILYR